MGAFAWLHQLVVGPGQSNAKRWDRESLSPTLHVKRLEERRVLNADAAPVEQLVVDAGSAAGDGQADTYVVEQHDDHVRISVNGQEVSRTSIADLNAIHIRGSLDDDILIAEFKSGEPLAGLDLIFHGGGGNDSVTLQGDISANDVTHELGTGENRVGIESVGGHSTITYQGVETVNDRLAAANRTFRTESGGQAISLGDDSASGNNVSQIVANDGGDDTELVILFENPTDSLRIESTATNEGPDSLELNGLDQDFSANLQVHGSPDDLLTVGGPTDLGGGNLELIVGTVRIEDSLTTSHATATLHAEHEIFVGESGVIVNDGGNVSLEAPSIVHEGQIRAAGGSVRLDSGEGGTTTVQGSIDVSQTIAGQVGGSVHVLGTHVVLLDGARIEASGASGGGSVLVGGDYQGNNPAVRNARYAYVGSNAFIAANATIAGLGGTVIIWANDVAAVYGNISARGGATGGDGGFVETSGKGYLDFRGVVDASASHGKGGTWLLDPINVQIAAATSNVVIPPLVPPLITLMPGGIPATIAALTIETALNLGINVTITTNVAGAQAGTITIDEAIDVNPTSAATLTLTANSNIIVNDAITADPLGALLHVVFNAGGNIILGAAIDAVAGNVTLQAAGTINEAAVDALPDIITTGTVTLIGPNGIGNLSTLELENVTNLILDTNGSIDVATDVALTALTLTVNPTGGPHTYSIVDDGNLTFEVNDNGANLDVLEVSVAAGDLDFTLTSDTGNVVLGTAVDLAKMVSVGGGDVSITATAGSITDGNAASNNIAANNLTLTANAAAQAIGASGNAIDVQLGGTLTASANTGAGGIFIDETGDMSIASVSAGSGSVRLSSTTTINESVNDNAAKITTTGALTLVAATGIGNTSKLDLASVTNLTLDTDGSIDVDGNVALTNLTMTVDPAGGPHTYLLSDNGNLTFEMTDGGANLNVLEVSTVAGNLNFTLTADTGNIVLGTLVDLTKMVDVNNGNVSITATGGSIEDGNAASTNISANNLTLSAIATGQTIGAAGNPLDVTLNGTLTASTGLGGIFIRETGDMSIASVASISGDVQLTSTGSINESVNDATDKITTTGAVALVSSTGIGNLSKLDLSGVTMLVLDTDGGIDVATDVSLTDLSVTVNPTGGPHTYLITDDGNLTFEMTDGGTNLNLLEASVTAGNLNFALTSDTGNIVLGTTLDLTKLVNVGNGDVTITATAGSITDGNAASNNVTANNLSLVANAAGQAIGAIGNPLEIVLTGTITASANTGAGGIFISETGNMSIASIAAGTGAVQLRSTAAINESVNDATAKIVTSGAVLLAGVTGIGNLSELELDGVTNLELDTNASFDVSTTAVLTDLTITLNPDGGAADTYTLKDNVPGASNLTFVVTDAGANLTVTDVSVAAGNLNLSLTSDTGNIQLSSIDVNAGQVLLTASDGSITDNNGAVNNITALNAALRADGGIGSGDALETAITNLAFSNTVTGDVVIVNTGALTITTVDGLATSINTGGGSISLAAQGAAGANLTINANLSASGGNGAINLFAADSVSVGTVTISAANAGAILLSAGTNFDGAALTNGIAAGNVLMLNGTVIRSDDGSITLRAPGNVQLGVVNADFDGDLTSGNIAVTADFDGVATGLSDGAGAISDVTVGEAANLLASTGTATLTAATGIGSADDIDTAIGSLVATNSTSGQILIQETNGLTVTGTGVRTLAGNGNIDIDVDAGDFTIDSVITSHGSGTVKLNADNGLVDIGAAVSSTSGQIDVTGNAVLQDANISTGLAANINVTTDTGDITMVDGRTTTTATGAISYKARVNVALSLLQSTGGGAIEVTAGDGGATGAITDITAAETANLQTTGTTTLTADTGIGSADDIDTSIGMLVSTNSTSGQIAIHESSGLIVTGTGVRTLGGNGNIDIDVDAGDFEINSVVTAHGSGTVKLNADDGLVDIGAAVSSTSGQIDITGNAVAQDANVSTGLAAAVNVTADTGDITMVDGRTTTTNTGSITYKARVNVALGLLNSTSGGAIDVTAGDGNVTGAITDITAAETPNLQTTGTATLTADTGIGSADDIDTAIGSLVATNSTSGQILIEETSGLIVTGTGVRTLAGNGNIGIDVNAGNFVINSVVTAFGSGTVNLNADDGLVNIGAAVSSTSGQIDVTGNAVTQDANISTGLAANVNVTADTGDITMVDGDSTTTDTGAITYSARVNVALGLLQSTGGGAINVTAGDGGATGAISDITAAETANIQTAGTATLIADTGIGSTDDIDTSIAALVATNNASNHIRIQEANGLTITGTGVRTLAGNGNIALDVDAGDFAIDSVVTAHGSGTVNLNADSGLVDIGADVSSTSGQIDVSGNAVMQDANIATGLAANVNVTADTGDITMVDGRMTTSNTGSIDYSARVNVALGLLQSTGGGAIDVTAGDGGITGAITDITAAETPNLQTTGTATLTADEGIGSLDDIDTAIGSLVATNSTTGQIVIQESNGLAIIGTGVRTLAGNGNIDIDVDAGNFEIDSVVTAHGSGTVKLNADNGLVDIDAAVSSTSGQIDVTGNAVAQDANISTGLAAIVNVTADTGDITMGNGQSTTTVTGKIDYQANGNVQLALLTSTSGAVEVTATTGSILDNNGTDTNVVTSSSLTLIASAAGQSIGTITNFSTTAGDAIETQVAQLAGAAANTIHLSQVGDLVLTGNVDIVGTGQAIIRTTLDLDASAANSITLSNNDNLALIAGDTLRVPTAGFDVGTGLLRMVGDTEVVNASNVADLTFAASDLFFHSGGGALGDHVTLNTTVASLTATLDLNNLTVAEANSIQLTNVATEDGSITVTTSAAGSNIEVGLVDADDGASNASLTGTGAISDLTNDAAADVIGNAVTLTAVTGINVDTRAMDITATNSGTGSIDLDEADGANLLNVAAMNGDVDVSTLAGNLQVSTVSAARLVLPAIVTLTATAGEIMDANGDTLNITATDLILDASAGIGIVSNAIETNVAHFVGDGGSGGLFLINDNALDIGGVVSAINGATANGAVDIQTKAGNLQVLEQVASSTQSVKLVAGMNLAANAGIQAATLATLTATSGEITDGNAGVVNVTATGLVATASTGINLDTTVEEITASNTDAGNIDLDESDGANLLNVTASDGNVDVSTLTGNLGVDTVSASAAVNAIVTLIATAGTITDINDTVPDTLNITATSLVLNAQVGIGTLTDAIETAVTFLTANSSAGGISVVDQGALIVNGSTSASGNVRINTVTDGNGATNDILLIGAPVTSTAASVRLLGADALMLNANVTAMSGEIFLSVSAPDVAALTMAQNVILKTGGGQIGGGRPDPLPGTIESTGPNVSILDNIVLEPGPGQGLTLSQNTAKIRITETDPDGTNYEIIVDWREDNPGDPRFVSAPIANSGTPVELSHTFDKNPEDKASDDIPIRIHLVSLAGDTIHPFIGGKQLLGAPLADGTLPANVIGVTFTLVIDVLSLPSVLPTIPPLETAPLITILPATLISNVETAGQEPQRGAVLADASAAGVTSEGEQRYYELRIVVFDEDGNLIELKDPKDRIQLDSEELKAIHPFNPSKLPALFGRLPADRYRIYLIEDGSERLVLEFIIQQGQPIETPEIEEIDSDPADAANPFGDDAGDEANVEDGAAAAIIERQFSAVPLDPSTDGRSFAERLGNASFVSHGGVVLGAAALSYAASDRWEKSIERVMERFDRRRSLPSRRRRHDTESITRNTKQREPAQLPL